MAFVVLKNLGEIVTGDLSNLARVGDTILIEDGIIKEIGFYVSMKFPEGVKEVDADFHAVAPAIIDVRLDTVGLDCDSNCAFGILSAVLPQSADLLPGAVNVHRTGSVLAPLGVWGKEFRYHIDDEEVSKADVLIGANGSPVSLPSSEAMKVLDGGKPIGLCANGNLKVAVSIVKEAKQRGVLDRIFVCSGSEYGRTPLNLWLFLSHLCWAADITGEQAIAMVTGNVAKIFGMDRGIIDVGKRAEFMFLSIPYGSEASEPPETLEAGDMPSIVGIFKEAEFLPTDEAFRIPTKKDEADKLLEDIESIFSEDQD